VDNGRVHFRSEWLPLVLIALFVVVMMWPFTLGGMALMPDTWKSIHPWAMGLDPHNNLTSIYDPVLEYEPWFTYAQTCLKEGRVPHWNPWQFCGAPLYANRLIPFFFPPFILAALIAAPHKLLGWFQLFNLIISGWGMYFLLRGWRMKPAVATASSCLYLTCGIHFLPFPLWTLGTIGFPWLLWSLDGFLEKPGPRPIAIASFIAGLILMVGYPVLVVHLSYFTAMYFIARWWVTRRTGVGRLHWSVPLIVLAVVYSLGFGASAVANVPAEFYAKYTARHVEGFADKAFEQEKRQLLATEEEAGLDVFTDRFGEQADILLPINGRGTQRAWQYAGILTYLLAFLGILAGRPRARLLGVLGLIFAALVWIPEVYVFLIDVLPGWALTILPPVEVVNLIACLLAACGIEAALDAGRKLDLPARIVISLLAVTAIFLAWRFLRDAPVIEAPIADVLVDKNLLANGTFYVQYLVAFTAISIAITLIKLVSSKIAWLQWCTVATVVLFALTTQWYLQPVYSRADYEPATPFTDWLKSTVDSASEAGFTGRIARWAELPLPFNPYRREKGPFLPNVQLKYGIPDVCGYDSLVPKRYIDYHSLFEESFMEYRALIAYQAPDTMHHGRFRDMAVRWIITQGELPVEGREGLRLVRDERTDAAISIGTDSPDDFMQVWEVIDPQPRVFLTRRVAYASDPLDNPLVQAANWNAQGIEAVVVEDASGENRTFAFPGVLESDEPMLLPSGDAEIVEERPEYLKINCDAPVECYLVLRDGWFPEWEAGIDGVAAPIYPADMAFRAVRVPPGEHTVEFRYDAGSFRLGMRITICTLALLAGLCIPFSRSTQR
jgi:hypothetical protein